jgi:mRNA-degrading endonuclease RelE of RelBE toxin-antitoxin system
MPKYRVVLSKRAFKFLDSLDGKTRQRVIESLDRLANYSFYDKSLDLCTLKGEKDYYRLRTGKIRIIFILDKSAQAILVRKIAYREAAYE